MVKILNFICGFYLKNIKSCLQSSLRPEPKASKGCTPPLCLVDTGEKGSLSYDLGMCPFPSGAAPPTVGSMGGGGAKMSRGGARTGRGGARTERRWGHDRKRWSQDRRRSQGRYEALIGVSW